MESRREFLIEQRQTKNTDNGSRWFAKVTQEKKTENVDCYVKKT